MHLVPDPRQSERLWAEHRELGLWLKNAERPGGTVMAATPVVSYYAGAGFEVLPYAGVDDMLRYARYKGVKYLVVDRAEIPTFRPQLTRLLNPARRQPGLDLVKSLHEGSSHAIFLYRLVPRVAATQ